MDSEASNYFRECHADDDAGTSQELTVTAIPHARLEVGIRLDSPKASSSAKYQLHRYRVRALAHMIHGWLEATRGWDVSGGGESRPEAQGDELHGYTMAQLDEYAGRPSKVAGLLRDLAEAKSHVHDRTDCPRCGETLRTSSYFECEEERDQLRLELHRLKTKYGLDTVQTISVAEHFSKFPGGRTQTDGPHSGEVFRNTVLAPALRQGRVRVLLDGTMGYGSSFLEEAFGGLLGSFARNCLDERLTVEATDTSLVQEVWEYIHKTPNPAR